MSAHPQTTSLFEPVPQLDLAAQYAAIGAEIRTAVERVLASQQFVLGREGAAFEQEIAQLCGVAHGIGVASGTDALILALRACGVQAGDEVLIPPFTFVATGSAVSALGAKPVFVDIRPDTYNLDPSDLARRLTPRTRAIIAVHLYGLACDMDPILNFARAHNLRVIEDNAQSIGATYRGKPTGSLADAACLSFYPTKNLGAYGDAGMVVTNSDEMAARLNTLRNHGQSAKYVSSEPGWNSRLDELQAAVLRVKLRHLDRWIAARRALAARYTERFSGLPGVRTPVAPAGREHSYYLYTLRISSDAPKAGVAKLSSRCDRVAQRLAESGIASSVFYPVPLHLQPLYAALGGKPGDLPVAERAAHEVLSLPLYPTMAADRVDRVADAVVEALRG
jgi:dTDP-4-amino-4,6-dideoxygalactose transaminase